MYASTGRAVILNHREENEVGRAVLPTCRLSLHISKPKLQHRQPDWMADNQAVIAPVRQAQINKQLVLFPGANASPAFIVLV